MPDRSYFWDFFLQLICRDKKKDSLKVILADNRFFNKIRITQYSTLGHNQIYKTIYYVLQKSH